MRLLLLGVLAALGACASKDPASAELERWRKAPHVYLAIDAAKLARDISWVGKHGARVTIADVKPRYLTTPGRNSAGEGPLVMLWTAEELVPRGVSYVPLKRGHALSSAEDVAESIGVCVDPDSSGRCRVALSREESTRLANLLVDETKIEEPLPFKVLRRP